MKEIEKREHWGSRVGFIFAAAGSAIGLGNIWMFPKTAGENGGGLFVLLYVFCVLVIGIPLMLAELSIGRASQSNTVGAFRKLAPGTWWPAIGGMGVLAGFLILSFYAVVGGWILIYLWDSITGVLTSLGSGSAEVFKTHFEARSGDPFSAVFFYFIFMLLTVSIVCGGVGAGIERWSKILMPVLLVLLVLVALRGLFLEGAGKGLEFLFLPKFEDFTTSALSAALSQAFFSLSLGMGAMITYGGYLRSKQNLPRSAVQIAGLDTGIGILAGMAIFPAIFAITPAIDSATLGGPGLIFEAFPQIFLAMFGGNVLMAQLFAISFFTLVLIAALTSSISLLEVVIAYFVDEGMWKRKMATIILGLVIFIYGVPSALYTGFFDLIAKVTYDYMLPIGGFFISIFAAWVWGRNRALIHIADGCPDFRLGVLWHLILRWIAPFIIFQIILMKILDDLTKSKIFQTPQVVIDTMQTAFTWVDGFLVGGALIAGVFYWFKRPKPLTDQE